MDSKHTCQAQCRDLPVDTVVRKVVAKEPFQIRFRNDALLMKLNDTVYGELKQEKQDRADFVVADHNQRPTERFMRIVDSVDVKLTHFVQDYRYLGELWHLLAVFKAVNLPAP